MKRKNSIRIFAILLAILFVIPCVSFSTTAAEAERTYAPASVALYLTYDAATGKPMVKNYSTFSAVVIKSDITVEPYTKDNWQNSTFGADENGFLTVKPDNTTGEFIVDLKVASDSWIATDAASVSYFAISYRLVGTSRTAEEKVLSVTPVNTKTGWFGTSANIMGEAKDGEWNSICQSYGQGFNTDTDGLIRLQFSPLSNPDSYIVIDYIAWAATEAEASAMKQSHDDYLKAKNDPISVSNQSAAQKGLVRDNVVYLDGFTQDNLTTGAGYLKDTNGSKKIENAITVSRPDEAYHDVSTSVTSDGYLKITTTEKKNAPGIKLTFNSKYSLLGNFDGMKYVAIRYKLIPVYGQTVSASSDVIRNQHGNKISVHYPAGDGWKMATGEWTANANDGLICWGDYNYFILMLPDAMNTVGCSIIIDYIGFFADEEAAKEEYKIQSLADGVDVGFAGVQSWKNDTEASVRFVGKLDVISDENGQPYTAVGFDLTANGKPNKTPIAANVVYTSIIADGEPVSAASLGTSYLFTYVVSGMDATVNADITFTVTPYAYYNGTKISGPTYHFRYNPSTDAFSPIA